MIIWTSYTKLPLGLFPICDAILELLPRDPWKTNENNSKDSGEGESDHELNRRGTFRVRMTRCVTLLITFIVAWSCPGFSAAIGFCAWIIAPSLIFAMPLACYLRLFPEEAAAKPVYHRLHQAIIVGSIIASVVGTGIPVISLLFREPA